jgi:hypothetical protein
MRFSELPSDLNDQLPAGAAPPAWFPVTGVITTSYNPSQFYSPQFNGADPSRAVVSTSIDPFYISQFYGMGDQEESEINPVEIVDELRLNQEMPPAIPLIANRYTKIDPLSPMFRADRPKYGYGDFTPADTTNLLKLLAGVALIYYFLLRKK